MYSRLGWSGSPHTRQVKLPAVSVASDASRSRPRMDARCAVDICVQKFLERFRYETERAAPQKDGRSFRGLRCEMNAPPIALNQHVGKHKHPCPVILFAPLFLGHHRAQGK